MSSMGPIIFCNKVIATSIARRYEVTMDLSQKTMKIETCQTSNDYSLYIAPGKEDGTLTLSNTNEGGKKQFYV